MLQCCTINCTTPNSVKLPPFQFNSTTNGQWLKLKLRTMNSQRVKVFETVQFSSFWKINYIKKSWLTPQEILRYLNNAANKTISNSSFPRWIVRHVMTCSRVTTVGVFQSCGFVTVMTTARTLVMSGTVTLLGMVRNGPFFSPFYFRYVISRKI